MAQPTGELKYWEPRQIRNRHLAIMEEMVASPNMSQGELAQKMGYTQSRLSIIVNSPLFKYAFEGYRRQHMEKVSDLVAEATTAALKFCKEVVEQKGLEVPLRQVSARDILNLGHAKAVEKSARLEIGAQVPAEMIEALRPVMEELKVPFAPKRFFQKPPEREGDDVGE